MKSIIFGFALAAAHVVGGTAVPTSTEAIAPPTSAPAPAAPAPTPFYEKMPMEAYQAGGYKELECGYGHVKQADGSCAPEAWVRYYCHC